MQNTQQIFVGDQSWFENYGKSDMQNYCKIFYLLDPGQICGDIFAFMSYKS